MNSKKKTIKKHQRKQSKGTAYKIVELRIWKYKFTECLEIYTGKVSTRSSHPQVFSCEFCEISKNTFLH